MAWRARLIWPDETIDIDGVFSTEDAAYDAANEAINDFHLGNSMSAWNGDDVDDSDPDIEVWDDDEDDDE